MSFLVHADRDAPRTPSRSLLVNRRGCDLGQQRSATQAW